MEHFNISTTWNESYEENNNSNSFNNNEHNNFQYCTINGCDKHKAAFISYVITWIIVCISLPLILLAIYSLSSLVRKDHGAPVYVINLLISDLVQIICMIAGVASGEFLAAGVFFYHYGLLSSVGFMVCISLERYLVIVWPLWYRFRRTIKTSVVVCVLAWILPLVLIFPLFVFSVSLEITFIMYAFLLLLPLSLFIFFLGGTLKALSASISVSSDEKRRIVAVLVVVLLIYILLFLPRIIWFLAGEYRKNTSFITLCDILLELSPLADLILYIFMRKGTTDKILASLCCCRMQLQESSDEQHEQQTACSQSASYRQEVEV
ncbi:proteinase-activated receptor 2-like [Mugil cephalus]|uniref:proteinase-activated receptor 2-like n=1 Tax=Mugil cephalus TaxID=48193 RepID=UPI001FB79A44|nr:proteinase-activated receptor 2-like [Mugil cephalus]XP_047458579.1 proteinase-activated receptor 2-like [Mugil cephalus]